jgi:hypothetical protein
MTTQDLIDFYVNLLIAEYRDQPNAQATIALVCGAAILDQIATQVRDGFNFPTGVGRQPDTAVGAQLDIIGSYRGVSREIFGVNVNNRYWVMPRYGDPNADTDLGFALYGNLGVNWFWISYRNAEQPVYTLNDDQLTRLIQLRAQVQSQLLSVQNVDRIMFDFFGDNVAVIEASPMHVTYIDLISDTDPLFGIANVTKSLPRPAGVGLSVLRSETINNFFGFQNYGLPLNPLFVGFGTYGTPQAGSFVRYG